jgi:hypothetical protein
VRTPLLLDLTLGLVWARRAVRGGALDVTIASLGAARRKHSSQKEGRGAERLWDYFQSRRVWFPAPYVCLFDSLALAMFAARRGACFELVFGVRGRPFAAHCWAEHEREIVNDAPEYCASFTPILRA